MRCVLCVGVVLASCGGQASPPDAASAANVAVLVNGQLELVAKDTAMRVPLATGIATFEWSHDGAHIAAVTAAGALTLFTVGASTGPTALAAGVTGAPHWSPDDTRLLVGHELVTLDGNRIALPSDAIDLEWSPGGRVVQPADPHASMPQACIVCTADGRCTTKACYSSSPEGDVYTRIGSGNNSHKPLDYFRTDTDAQLGEINSSDQLHGQNNDLPWSADSNHVVMGTLLPGTLGVFLGASTATLPIAPGQAIGPSSWSPDGRFLMLSSSVVDTTTLTARSLSIAVQSVAWAPTSDYASVSSCTNSGSTATCTASLVNTDAVATPLPIVPSDVVRASVFSKSGHYFALGTAPTFICDREATSCNEAGTGSPIWIDDGHVLLWRPECDGTACHSLTLFDRASQTQRDLVPETASAVAVRP